MSLVPLSAGFLPLLDSVLLVLAREKGFAEAQGLDLHLVRETSWANIRDRAALGHFDFAQIFTDTGLAALAQDRVSRARVVHQTLDGAIGALVGAFVFKVGSVPLTLSTSGGALISGLFFGWLRSVHPTFGRIPSSTVWFMNSVGLNVFIAVVGISSGPGFVAGLQQLGFSLFLWGVVVTTVPLTQPVSPLSGDSVAPRR